MTFGTSFEEKKKAGFFGNLYSSSNDEKKSPTFVKPFFALPSYPVQYLYRRVFEKIAHFTEL